MTYRIRH